MRSLKATTTSELIQNRGIWDIKNTENTHLEDVGDEDLDESESEEEDEEEEEEEEEDPQGGKNLSTKDPGDTDDEITVSENEYPGHKLFFDVSFALIQLESRISDYRELCYDDSADRRRAMKKLISLSKKISTIVNSMREKVDGPSRSR